MNNLATKIELHDGSAPPTKEERIEAAMSEDIRSGGDITSDLASCDLMLDDKGEFKCAYLMRLADSVEDAGTRREFESDRLLGEYIRKQLVWAMREHLEEI